MPRTVAGIDVLQEYISGVMDRAAHHAGEVEQIALAIAGAIVWRHEGAIRVYEREGKMKNALWVTINHDQYALSYNHDAGTIEIKRDNMRGKLLASFDNKTPIQEVKAFFEHL